MSMTKFLIENISLPPEVEAMLDKRSEMGLIGNVQQYAAFQAANAIPDAAKTPNSLAGAGMGLAAGMAMGGQMANLFNAPQQPQPAAQPQAAAPQAPKDPVERLKKLDSLKAAGVLTEEEYAKKRAEILAEL
jgi:membrane protease subunit (stomatin/prohibitin family)